LFALRLNSLNFVYFQIIEMRHVHVARFCAHRRPRLSGTTVPYIDSKTWGKVGANCHIFKVVDVKHRYWDHYALGLYEESDVTLVAGEQVKVYMDPPP
jgi:hypothetical protein